MNKEQQQALEFFKTNHYHRLFLEFKKKYESLGRIGGAVSIKNYSEEELIQFSLFFGMPKEKLIQKGRLHLATFEKQLQRTRFEGMELKELLEAYFETKLISNKEHKENKEKQTVLFLDSLIEENKVLSDWLRYIKQKSPDTYWIYGLMESSTKDFEDKVNLLNRTMSLLPHRPIRLPVFSQRVTGNPHAFDRNTTLGKLFLHVLSVKEGVAKEAEGIFPKDSEALNELLLSYNILRDDITNYVTVANIGAETKNGKSELWEVAAKTHSVLNIPLRELLDVTRLYTINPKPVVWIVENSGVFSSILDDIPGVPLICTHGQFKLAAWQVIDKFTAENYTLYYASDIDPEGLGMAERLYLRHPNHIRFWKMDIESYEKSLSEIDILSNNRLKKLDSLSVGYFNEVKKKMKKVKHPGYQEALIDEMLEEMKYVNE